MKRIIVALLLCIIVAGCGKTEYSEVKQETAEVITMNYIPVYSQCNVAPGMTTNGDLTFSIHNNYQPEKYIVMLRCSEHNNTFAIESKELFNKVKIGSVVTLNYVDEIYIDDKNNRSIQGQHTRSIEVSPGDTVNRD